MLQAYPNKLQQHQFIKRINKLNTKFSICWELNYLPVCCVSATGTAVSGMMTITASTAIILLLNKETISV